MKASSPWIIYRPKFLNATGMAPDQPELETVARPGLVNAGLV